jgi:hypothetical protein
MAVRHQINLATELEIVQAFTLAPWEARIPIHIRKEAEDATILADTVAGTIIATSTSLKQGRVAAGTAIYDTTKASLLESPVTIGVTIGTNIEQNPYTAELVAIANGLQTLSRSLGRFQFSKQIYIITSSQSALQAINNPSHQLGQD